MTRIRSLLALAAAALLASAASVRAQPAPVGERHLEATNPTAALRDADHRTTVHVTIWYPAAEGAVERSLDIGPPGRPLFFVGEAAPDAPFADDRRRPVILFSHGYGGSARMMAWFTTVLAQQGYVVIAVDHPGNSSVDKMTVAGAALFWDRVGDLQAALDRAKADPILSAHMDARRLAVAGFANGGLTALIAGGGRVDLARFQAFCASHPEDGVCKPQPEFPVTLDQAAGALASPELAPEAARAADDHSIRGVGAVFVMAPAFVQALDPASLANLSTPVGVILGEGDPVAAPRFNGGVVARAAPRAKLKGLPGVGHYDFISTCSQEARASLAICQNVAPQNQTHHDALEMALNLFANALGPP